MLLTGRIIDCLGARITAAVTLTFLGASGLVVAVTTTGFISMCIGLLLVGAASGAADVAINTAAGSAEQISSRPVITRSHGLFSASVVVSSLAAGISAAWGADLALSFGLVMAASVTVSGYLLFCFPALTTPISNVSMAGNRSLPAANAAGGIPVLGILLVGVLGALAFAGENAHQSWAAVFFEDEFGAGPALSATAPAVFAAVVAITRFSTSRLKPVHASRTLVFGSAAAGVGAAIVAAAPNLVMAIIGLSMAAAGTAVLYPTLLGIVSRSTDEATRGRATSLLTSISYLGFLFGPVYVGLWSEVAGLRAAIGAIAALSLALLILIPFVLRLRQSIAGPAQQLSAYQQKENDPSP